MKVYQLCIDNWGSDQTWMAIGEDGVPIASHISSSREWGIHDTGPNGFHKDKWPEDYEQIIIPEGENVPDEVLALNKAWYEASEAVKDADSGDSSAIPSG